MIKLKDLMLIKEHEDKEGKMFHESVVYVTPDVINQGRPDNDPGCRCGKCVFFKDETSECILTKPSKCNAEHGVCCLFLGRPNQGPIQGATLGLISKKDAGYIEDDKNVPTMCGNCEYYAEMQGVSKCKIIADPIYKTGCCNRWEPK